MVEVKAVIQNEAGIHCRPTAVITQEAVKVDSVVTVLSPGGVCELGSALDLMMLGLEQGTMITLQVKGLDEEQVAEQFKSLFETEFDFPHAGE